MGWIPDRYHLLRRLLRARGNDPDDVRLELEQHYDQLVRDSIAEGLSRSDAEARARERFGDIEEYRAAAASVAREATRRHVRRVGVATLVTDLKVGTRGLSRRPGFSTAVLATLTLALAGTAITVGLVDQVLLRPLPYASADELVTVQHPVPGLEEGQEWNLSAAGYFYFRENSTSLAELGVWSGTRVTLAGDEGAERARAVHVSASVFTVLGARPALGRLFDEGDNAPDAARTVVLSHGTWMRRFAGDPSVVGSTLRINAVEAEIVGVLEAGFDHPITAAEVWIPLTLDPTARAVNSHWLAALGRLSPSMERETAERELAALTTRLPEVFPTAYSPDFMQRYRFDVRVGGLHDAVVGDLARVLWILLAAAALVLVVATSNVAGLFLVRAEARRQEMAVRASLGASSPRLAWVGALEAVLLVAAAALFGLVLAAGALSALTTLQLDALPEIFEPSLSVRAVLAVSILATGVMMLVAGVARIVPTNVSETLRSGGTLGMSRARRLLREAMVVGQLGLALTLATGAGLLVRSVGNLTRVDSGLDTDATYMADVALPALRYPRYDGTRTFFEQLTARLEALPEIRHAGTTTTPPLSGSGGCSLVFVENYALGPDERPPCVATPLVSPGYFEALGIEVEGESPRWSRVELGEVVVSRAFADRFWPNENAIGKGLRPNGDEPPFYRVAGVADDVRADGLDRPVEEAVYFPVVPLEGAPLWSPPRAATLVISGPLSMEALAPVLRREISALDVEVPVSQLRTVRSVIASSTRSLTLASALITGAALLALFLSALGVYGLMAYLVAQQRPEIGVRMALGADRATVVRSVFLRAMGCAALGVALGLAGSLLVGRPLRALLFGVEPIDVATLGVASAALITVAALSVIGPARRAAAISPVEALRGE